MFKEDDMIDFDGGYNTPKPDDTKLNQEHGGLTTTTDCASTVEQIQERYQKLLEQYNTLKKHSDEHGAVENTSTRSGETDPYVIALIDAHSHRFKGNLMQGAESGGGHAAKMLREAITEYIATLGLEEHICRIDARVYANLKGLSLEIIKTNTFSRALGAFAGGFSRAGTFFDFVDVVDEATVESRIIDLFKMYVKDPQCKHLFFGASGSVKYVHVLQEHSVFAEKVTIVQRDAEDTSLTHLGLKGVVFSQTFDSLAASSAAATTLRVNTGKSPKISLTATTPLPIKSVRGRIPVNAAGERLDIYLRTPTAAHWDHYNALIQDKKPCNAFHIEKSCSNDPCGFDHSPITAGQRFCLDYFLKTYPCKNEGACRRLDCYHGHICQRNGCLGQKPGPCKFNYNTHHTDLRVAKWVRPENGDSESENRNGSKDEEMSSKRSMESCKIPTGSLIDV
ncbi:hypothetical protein BKA66DRAFT_584843 [Pyrenochaeta sp. MPI-SDFR-AT-0127]|nr:hypothetical protein BKA66DRAFT_584843 [Pyrenochaeta sp. MPI-SDFR-AT-0127]